MRRRHHAPAIATFAAPQPLLACPLQAAEFCVGGAVQSLLERDGDAVVTFERASFGPILATRRGPRLVRALLPATLP